jgi:hypothetical protein
VCERCGAKTKGRSDKRYCSAACKIAAYREKPGVALKEAARGMVAGALLAGRLVRPGRCEGCGQECFAQAHHQDYGQPLSVDWLCRPCHSIAHGRAPHSAQLGRPRLVVMRQREPRVVKVPRQSVPFDRRCLFCRGPVSKLSAMYCSAECRLFGDWRRRGIDGWQQHLARLVKTNVE